MTASPHDEPPGARGEVIGRPENDLTRRLEALWGEGSIPQVSEIIRQESGLAPAQIAEALRVDQRNRWMMGEPTPVASYLNDFPCLHADPEAVLDLIWSEYLIREALGDSPELERYARDYPQYASLLHRQFEVHRWVEQADNTPQPAGHSSGPSDPTPPNRPLPAAQPRGHLSTNSDTPSFRLPGYDVLGVIGQGGMGIVYKARQVSLDRIVALKVLSPAFAIPERLARFRNEAAIVAKLSNIHIVSIYDVIVADCGPVLVMPYVEGRDLAQILADRGVVRRGETSEGRHPSSTLADREFTGFILAILDQLVAAVAAIHRLSILHRDIKPSNVLVDGQGRAWLADFGLARLADGPAHTGLGTLLGTPGYMSPEQWCGAGDIDGRADLFGLGATLYEALTLGLPYGRRPITSHAQRPARISAGRPWLSADADAVVFKALELDRADRYTTADELERDWRRFRSGLLPEARRAGIVRRLIRRARRHPWGTSNLLIGVALLGALGLGLWRTPTSAKPDPAAPRQVKLETRPPGARAILVPLDPDDGLPHPERAIETPKATRTPLAIRVPPGDYFVEVELPDGRFHQVYRHIPEPGGIRPGSYLHQRWMEEDGSGAIVVPTIEIPPRGIEAGMTTFGESVSSVYGGQTPGEIRPVKVAAFHLDTTEVTVAQYGRFQALPPEISRRDPRPTDAVCYVTFDAAMDCAEKMGKRLPNELEYLAAATAYGSQKYPWGKEPGPLYEDPWDFGSAGQPAFDHTSTTPPVFGLCTNVEEWNVSWITSDPRVFRDILPPDFREGRGVRGGPFNLVERKIVDDKSELGPQFRHSIDRRRSYPGLGFRCARSVKPLFLRPLSSGG